MTGLRLRRYGWTEGTNYTRDAEADTRATNNDIDIIVDRDAGSVKRSPMQISRLKNEECSIRDLGKSQQDYTYSGNHVSDDAVCAATKHLDLWYAALYWWRTYSAGSPPGTTTTPRLVTIIWSTAGEYDYETYTGAIIDYNWQRMAGQDAIPYTLTLMKGVTRA
jgi:hypothetical protein